MHTSFRMHSILPIFRPNPPDQFPAASRTHTITMDVPRLIYQPQVDYGKLLAYFGGTQSFKLTKLAQC
jgi:hypothetical protein